MPGRCQKSLCVVAAILLAFDAGSVRAEGFFEFLFGKFDDSAAQTAAQKPTTQKAARAPAAANADPAVMLTVRPRNVAFVRGTLFCVRMCDGRYFPIQRSAAVEPSKICNSLCPASKTKVFAGAEISSAVAADGSRYSTIDHAFLYRAQTVEDCSCNGVTSYGLAAMDAREDPTLRAGDMVATPRGLVASSALPKNAINAAAERDDAIATGSALPLGLRGKVKAKEDFVLRRSGPSDLLPLTVQAR